MPFDCVPGVALRPLDYRRRVVRLACHSEIVPPDLKDAAAPRNDHGYDAAIAEFNALRTEILANRQVETTLVTAALTILAAVGGFALAKTGTRREIVLVLPPVLCGLGLIFVRSMTQTARIGTYIRDRLWEQIISDSGRTIPSWEGYLTESLYGKGGTAYSVVTVLPPALIFAVPSVASLAITHAQSRTNLWPLWWAGVLAIVALVGLWVLSKPKTPQKKKVEDNAGAGPSGVSP